MSGDAAPADEHPCDAYTRTVCELHVDLRGTGGTVAGLDWILARVWWEEGIPIWVVATAMREVAARRLARQTKGKKERAWTLKYYREAVEEAFELLHELRSPSEGDAAPLFDLEGRLGALASALGNGLSGRVLALRGEPEGVEAALSMLDREMLAEAAAGLDAATREEIEAAATATLKKLPGRVPIAEREKSRPRLIDQLIRSRCGLPVLSLFSLDAEPVAQRSL